MFRSHKARKANISAMEKYRVQKFRKPELEKMLSSTSAKHTLYSPVYPN